MVGDSAVLQSDLVAANDSPVAVALASAAVESDSVAAVDCPHWVVDSEMAAD